MATLEQKIKQARALGMPEEEIRRRVAMESGSAPATQSSASKSSGGLQDWLPTILGVGGAALGSVIAPGVGTIGGGAAGSALGEAIRQRLSGENDLGRVAGEGALGLIGGGVGKVVGKVGGVALKQVTQKAPERLMAQVFKEAPSKAKQAVRSGTSLHKEALERGVKGRSDQSIYDGAVKRLDELEDSLQHSLRTSKKTIPLSEVRRAITPLVGEYKKAGNTEAAEAITRRLTAIGKQSKNGTLSLSDANKIKRTLYDEIKDSKFGKLSTPQAEGLKTIARGLKEGIAKRAPSANAINKDLSFYGRTAGVMEDRLAKSGRLSLMDKLSVGGGAAGLVGGTGGLSLAPAAAKLLLGNTAGQTYTAQALRGVGKLGQKAGVAGPIASQSVGQPIARIPSAITPTPSVPIEDPTVGLPLEGAEAPVDEAPILSPGGQWRWDATANDWVPNQPAPEATAQTTTITREQALAAIQRDMQTTGGKNIDKIIKIFELANPKVEENELDADQKKLLGKLRTADTLLDRFEKSLASIGLEEGGLQARGTGLVRGAASALGLDAKVKVFNDIRSGTASLLAKSLGEVGNLAEGDVQRAISLIPEVTDTTQEAALKLAEIRAIINGSRSAMTEGGQ